jgi:hypothetical protein
MGVGHDLVHSLDYVVLLQVMFSLASGVESTPLSVWEQLTERGNLGEGEVPVTLAAVQAAMDRLISGGMPHEH